MKDYSMNASKIKIIPISIPERKINNGQKGAYFLYFGYMVRRKGLGYALEGFKKFVENNSNTDYKLVLAGGVIEGQEKALQEIEDLILDYGLKDKVVIKGFVEESELDELYRHATAAVIPAKVSMGSSGPLFHASSFGKCAIASKIGHFLEDIDHRKTGVLTENDKWDEAFQFIADNPAQLEKIEINIREKSKSKTPSLIAQKTYNAYTSL